MLKRSFMKCVGKIALMLLVSGLAHASSFRIVLDPAHGGPDDPGFVSNGFEEKTINLQLAKKIQAFIETDDKYEVVLTRIGDYPVGLNDRRKIANQYESSVFLSIHSSTYTHGSHIYSYLMKQPTLKQTPLLLPIEMAGIIESVHSQKLAQTFEEEFPEHLDHQIVVSKYLLPSIIGVETPAVMIECQCVSQAEPTKDDGTIDDVARTISDVVQSFIRKNL